MITKVFNTVFSRGVVVALNLCIALLYTNIGAHLYGQVVFLNLIIYFSALPCGVLTGNSTVYYAGKVKAKYLLSLAFAIVLGSSLVVLLLLFLLQANINVLRSFDDEVLFAIPVLVFLSAALAFFQNYNLGVGFVKSYNFFTVTLILIQSLSAYFYSKIWQDVTIHILSLITAYGFSVFIALIHFVKHHFKRGGNNNSFHEILRFGFRAQLNQVLQISYERGNYFILLKFLSMAELGIFSLGLQFVELVKNLANSISTVLLSKAVSVRSNNEYKATIFFMKFTMTLTIVVLCFLMMVPSSIWNWALGDDFEGLRWILLSLFVYSVSETGTIFIRTFYIGTGNQKAITHSILIALAGVFTLSILLVNYFGLVGAGISSSVVSFVVLVYLLKRFLESNSSSMGCLRISKKELHLIRKVTKSYFVND
ncbi:MULTISPECIES: lipopolysaccharide biosynthesis protein [unclassified Carboxylicivirga]|uniref:lipopolysaccharide biosynthesis protein n=1 Tax=Carboxylicivirga TaxID=1628153 RepID=UPI003D32F8E6